MVVAVAVVVATKSPLSRSSRGRSRCRGRRRCGEKHKNSWKKWKNESRDLLLSPSHSDLVVQSSRFARFVRNREILDLSMVSGPVLQTEKEKGLMSILLGINNTNKNESKTNTWDEIGQMLVSRALDDTETIGKAGADSFAHVGAGKP